MIEAFEGISAMECATRATNQMKLGATSENQYEAGRCSMITRLIHNSLSLSLSLLSLSLSLCARVRVHWRAAIF